MEFARTLLQGKEPSDRQTPPQSATVYFQCFMQTQSAEKRAVWDTTSDTNPASTHNTLLTTLTGSEHAADVPLQTAALSRTKEAMSVSILLVDDSPHVRANVRTLIEQRTDWTVSEAENGEAALTMVVSLKPHFVVLDLSMPGMNGLEAARRISLISPGLPMIMFTMHDSHLLLKEALAVGITHVFSKGSGFGNNVIRTMRAMLGENGVTTSGLRLPSHPNSPA